MNSNDVVWNLNMSQAALLGPPSFQNPVYLQSPILALSHLLCVIWSHLHLCCTQHSLEHKLPDSIHKGAQHNIICSHCTC